MYMDEDAEKRSCDVDRLSNLPDSLLFQVLLNLHTKDVVKSSVLSSRWRHLWRFVPGLDLKCGDFQDCNTFVSFVDTFLGFNSQSCIQNFKFKYNYFALTNGWKWDESDIIAHVTLWINSVIKRKVQHLHVQDSTWMEDELWIPPTVIHFANDLAFEMLITGCPVLESLIVWRSPHDNVKVLRVCSKSLLSFTFVFRCDHDSDEDLVVEIDAPRLEYLELDDHETASCIIKNPGSLVKVDIDILSNLSFEKTLNPNDQSKINMIRNFLLGISSVKDMVISLSFLKVIYDYSRCERLTLFRNLSFLRVDLYNYSLEMLTTILESCPNLKSLVVIFKDFPEMEEFRVLSIPQCFLSSLEYVEIVRPVTGKVRGMKLVSYFLENAKNLKKLTLCLDDYKNKEESAILKKLLTIPRPSTSCQIVIR